jgi:phosphate starvation-inducible PhoH-like protein
MSTCVIPSLAKKLIIPSLSITPPLPPVRSIVTLTDKQHLLLQYLEDPETKACFALGPAGTGKTYMSCQYAIQELVNKNVKKIVVTKPFITVSDEAIGFLPGGIQSKLEPWMQNVLHCMTKTNLISNSIVKRFVDSKQIEFTAMGFMRGTTLENTIVIGDEMQNSSPSQMKMLLTRLGNNTKMIMTGDINQKDIRSVSGIEDFLGRYQRFDKPLDSIKIVQFDLNDVKREGFVKQVLEIYESKSGESKKDTLSVYKALLSDKKVSGGFNDSAMIPKNKL